MCVFEVKVLINDLAKLFNWSYLISECQIADLLTTSIALADIRAFSDWFFLA